MLQQNALPTTNRLSANRTIADAPASGLPAKEAGQRAQLAALGAGRVLRRTVGDALWLPDSLGSFLLFTLALAAITGCLVLHLTLSVKILRTEQQIAAVRVQRARVERQNAELTFQISEVSALSKMQTRAQALGFINTGDQHYVALKTEPASTPLLAEGTSKTVPDQPEIAVMSVTEPVSDQPQPGLLKQMLNALDFRTPPVQAMR